MVVPVLDAASTVVATLRSVLAQDRDGWELIVCDDGSADDTLALVEGLRGEFGDRLVVVDAPARPRTGPGATRTRGLAVARGGLVCFLDADDLWASDFLSTMSAWFDRYPDLVLAWSAIAMRYPHDPAKDRSNPLEPRPSQRFEPPGPAGAWLRDLWLTPNPSSVLWHADRFRDLGGWPDLRRSEDTYAHVRAAVRGPVAFEGRSLVTVLRHVDSTSNRLAASGTRDDLEVAGIEALLRLAEQEPLLATERPVLAASLLDAVWRANQGRRGGARAVARVVRRHRATRRAALAAPLVRLPGPVGGRVAAKLLPR